MIKREREKKKTKIDLDNMSHSIKIPFVKGNTIAALFRFLFST